MSQHGYDADEVWDLATAIWNKGVRADGLNDWPAAMTTATAIYCARIQAEAIEELKDGIFEAITEASFHPEPVTDEPEETDKESQS
jgi:hypothetical protein